MPAQTKHTNTGSRGKIHERCCQGLIASSESQRQTVTPEICSQIPRATASAASSEDDQRASGTWLPPGRSHASRMTSARTCGGKSRRSAAPGPVLEAGETLLEEPLAPLRNDIATATQPGGDLVVAHPIGSHQHHLGPRHLPIRQRIRARQRPPAPRAPPQSTRSDTGCGAASPSLRERIGCRGRYGQNRTLIRNHIYAKEHLVRV